MNRNKNPLTVPGAWLALGLGFAHVTHAADRTPLTGTLEGRVSNPATGSISIGPD